MGLNTAGNVTRLTRFLVASLISFVAISLVPAPPASAEISSQAMALLPTVATEATKDLEDLQRLDGQVKAAVEKTLRATVAVRVGGRRGGYAFGTGVLISEDGYVLTAAHVASRPNRHVEFRLSDGRLANGITLGLNQDLDMGLMKITDRGPWPFLRRARSGHVKEGDWCVAAGYPGGFGPLASGQGAGDDFALIRVGKVLKTTRKVLLTDCALVGGDSGGPLVDLNGNVIGVHSRIGADLTTNLHVPVDRYAEGWERLVKKDVWGKLQTARPWIGVAPASNSNDAIVGSVRNGSPAERAGLRSGDVIIRFNDQRVGSFENLKRLVAKHAPGDKISIQVRRNESTIETPISIGVREEKQVANSQTRDDADLLRDWLGRISSSPNAIFNFGKNADQVKQAFHDALETVSRSTVVVLRSRRSVALGTVVDSSGLILTKASELNSANGELRVRARMSRPVAARKIAELAEYDLALLSVDQALPAVNIQDAVTPTRGTLLATSSIGLWPVAVGVTSGQPLLIPSEGRLGIVMDDDAPRVARIVADSGADIGGMEVGDLVKAINDQAINTADDLKNAVRAHYPGDVLRLLVARNAALVEVQVQLGRYSEFDEALAEFEDFIGGQLSHRRTGFSRVVQHDTALMPKHCGGPVIDVHGRFAGINIARASRTTSYLLPPAEVVAAVQKLKVVGIEQLVGREASTKRLATQP